MKFSPSRLLVLGIAFTLALFAFTNPEVVTSIFDNISAFVMTPEGAVAVIMADVMLAAPKAPPAPIVYDSMKSAGEALAALQKQLNDIRVEAGKDFDMSLVKLISGSSQEKVDQIKVLNDQAAAAHKQYGVFVEIANADAEHLKTQRNLLGVIGAAPSIGGDPGGHQAKSIGELFVSTDAFKNYKSSPESTIGEGFNVKTLFERTAGWEPESIRTGKVVPIATTPLDVIDIMAAGRTSQEAVKYMEETTFVNNAVEVAEGGAYPEVTLELTERTSIVQKIAAFLPVTDEQMADETQVGPYLNNRIPFMIKQRLNEQILNGDGAGSNLKGILNTPGIQNQIRTSVVGDENEDAIYRATVLVQTVGQAIAEAVIINPINWTTIRLRKTSDGIYIFGSPAETGPTTLWGLPVVQAQSIPLGTALVGAFKVFSELAERMGITLQVSNSHSDFFVKGKQAIRAQMRAALIVYRPAAFCTVTALN